MSLLTQSDQRKGEAFSNQLLWRRVEQAAVNKAIAILDEQPSTADRQTWATNALAEPQAATVGLMPYVTQNAIVQSDGGEISDGDLEFVVQTEVIDGLYPAA